MRKKIAQFSGVSEDTVEKATVIILIGVLAVSTYYTKKFFDWNSLEYYNSKVAEAFSDKNLAKKCGNEFAFGNNDSVIICNPQSLFLAEEGGRIFSEKCKNTGKMLDDICMEFSRPSLIEDLENTTLGLVFSMVLLAILIKLAEELQSTWGHHVSGNQQQNHAVQWQNVINQQNNQNQINNLLGAG